MVWYARRPGVSGGPNGRRARPSGPCPGHVPHGLTGVPCHMGGCRVSAGPWFLFWFGDSMALSALNLIWEFDVEVLRSSVSFMSELDSFYLGSIGLLGEYRPTSRKKHICFSEDFGHIHTATIRDFISIKSRHFMQPAFLEINSKEGSNPLSFTADTV
ncbi:hypothetical protein M5K25_011103 [Dendrobium thyrsiflorum]|uniref:Uncharacterized protein n=1 Tax=Dendrobium thyrsiflorum TaxID=117978 RepID=A0ABD0V277_DENTH